MAALSTNAHELEGLLCTPLRLQKPSFDDKGCNIVQHLPFGQIEQRLPARDWIVERLRRFDLDFASLSDWRSLPPNSASCHLASPFSLPLPILLPRRPDHHILHMDPAGWTTMNMTSREISSGFSTGAIESMNFPKLTGS